MSGVWPITRRILRSIRGDRRTLGLVAVVPAFIVFLISETFADPQQVAPPLFAVLVFLLTYLLTAIGFLRERRAGTLERILVAPISRTSIVVGYILGYGILAGLQAVVLLGASIVFLDLTFVHGIGYFFALELLGALTAIGIGFLLSIFARNEFQAVQFIPLVITPQILLGGTFLPVEQLPLYLRIPSYAMPIRYLIEGMDYVILGTGHAEDFWIAIAVLVEFTVLAIGVSQLVVKRSI